MKRENTEEKAGREPRRFKVERGDAALLRAELPAGARVVEDGGEVFVEHDHDEVDGVNVDYAVRRAMRRALVAKIRQAKNQSDLRDAVADALEALIS